MSYSNPHLMKKQLLAVALFLICSISFSQVTLAPFADICSNSSTDTLKGGLPTGGTYSGTGVTNGIFDPRVSGVGTFTITYKAFVGGALHSATSTITVKPAPALGTTITNIDQGIVMNNDNQNYFNAHGTSSCLSDLFPSGGFFGGYECEFMTQTFQLTLCKHPWDKYDEHFQVTSPNPTSTYTWSIPYGSPYFYLSGGSSGTSADVHFDSIYTYNSPGCFGGIKDNLL